MHADLTPKQSRRARADLQPLHVGGPHPHPTAPVDRFAVTLTGEIRLLVFFTRPSKESGEHWEVDLILDGHADDWAAFPGDGWSRRTAFKRASMNANCGGHAILPRIDWQRVAEMLDDAGAFDPLA